MKTTSPLAIEKLKSRTQSLPVLGENYDALGTANTTVFPVGLVLGFTDLGSDPKCYGMTGVVFADLPDLGVNGH